MEREHSAPSLSDAQRSKLIDKELEKDRLAKIEDKKDPRILILGTSDSGKSTLVKQMKILFSGGFTPEEVFILMN